MTAKPGRGAIGNVRSEVPDPPHHVGLLLRRARAAAKIQVGEAARAAGCSKTLLSLIECGKRRLVRSNGNFDLEAVARLYGLSEEEMREVERAIEDPYMNGVCFGEVVGRLHYRDRPAEEEVSGR